MFSWLPAPQVALILVVCVGLVLGAVIYGIDQALNDEQDGVL